MSMYPFSYSAVHYAGTDSATGLSKYRCESGMGFCDSFSEAAYIITERYGDDLICIKDLTLYEEDSVILLPTEIIRKYTTDPFHECAQFRCDGFGNPIDEKNMFADLVNEDGTFKNPDNFKPIPLRERNEDGTFKKPIDDTPYVIGKPTNCDAKIPIED